MLISLQVMEEMRLMLGKSEADFNLMKGRVKKVFQALEGLMTNKPLKKVCEGMFIYS